MTVSLASYTGMRTVKWRCALVFAAAGIVGAAAHAHTGKMVDEHGVSFLFGVLMLVVGAIMLRPPKSGGNADTKLTRQTMCWLVPTFVGNGLAVGLLSVLLRYRR